MCNRIRASVAASVMAAAWLLSAAPASAPCMDSSSSVSPPSSAPTRGASGFIASSTSVTAGNSCHWMVTSAAASAAIASLSATTATTGWPQKKTSSSASGAAAGTGTAGTSSASMDNKFKLIGGDEDDLKKYVNTKVEIRGTLEKSSMPSSGAATGTGTGAAGSRPQSGDQNLPGLRVTSVRQVAQSCSGN